MGLFDGVLQLVTIHDAREYEGWRDAHTWDPSRGTELVIETDLAPAAWIEPRLLGHWSAVLAMVPGGFDAYARMFFPFEGEDGALRHEQIAVALTGPESIILAGPDGQAEPDAYCGFLPRGEFSALLQVLTRHTASAQSWFLLWDGWGNLNERAFSKLPKVNHPGRDLIHRRICHLHQRDTPRM